MRVSTSHTDAPCVETGTGNLNTMNQAAFSATRRTNGVYRAVAALVIFTVLTPLLTATRPASAQLFGRRPGQAKPGMTTRNKVLLLGGAALLYYLYKKHQAKQAEVAQAAPNGSAVTRPAQLYRSKNGGIYYRDPSGKPVWLTVPNQDVRVPAEEVQQYAPDYNRYRGPAPAAPRGYRTENFSDFDSSAMTGSNGTMYPSGPRRN